MARTRSFFTFFSASYDFTGYAEQVWDHGLYRTLNEAKAALADWLSRWEGATVSDDGMTGEALMIAGSYRQYVRFEVSECNREVSPSSSLRFAKREIPLSEYKGDTPNPSPTMVMWVSGRKYEVANPEYDSYIRKLNRVKGI